MEIAKAIETLEELVRDDEEDKNFDATNAVKLGIEALKRIYNNRATTPGSNFIPLPGETKD